MRLGWFLSYLVIGGILYGSTLNNGFYYDDQYYIVKNAGIRSLENLPEIFLNKSGYNWDPRAVAHYRPLVTASYAVSYALGGGLAPAAFHGINLILHVLCAFLTACLLRRLTGEAMVGFLGGAIFLIHPINTEAVNYLTARSSQMYALFYLLAFYAYLRFHPPYVSLAKPRLLMDRPHEEGKTRAALFLGLAFLSFLLSLLCKEMAITLPLALFFYEGMLRTPKRWRDWLRAGLVPAGFLLSVVLPYLAMRASVFGEALPSYWSRDLSSQMATQTGVLIKILGLFLFPVNLTIDHPVILYPSFLNWQVMGYAGLLAGILYGILRWGRSAASGEKRIAAFLGVWFFLSLLVVVIYPLNAILQENRLYLAVVGLAGLGALGLARLWKWGYRRSGFVRYAALAGIVGLLFIYAGVTVQRNTAWQDDISLWEDAVSKNPSSIVSLDNLGVAYGRASRWDLAVEQYRRSLTINPNNPFAVFNIGFAAKQQGRLKEAEDRFKETIRLAPYFFMAHYNLGVVYAEQGRWEEAIASFREVTKWVPGDAMSRYRLADALMAAGRTEEAMGEFEGLLKHKLDDPKLKKEIRDRMEEARKRGHPS